MKRIKSYIKLFAKKLLYGGNRHICQICGHKAKKFKSFGKPKRKNAQCPFCNSLERTRFLWYALNKNRKFTKNCNILHFAPNVALGQLLLNCNKEKYISADINPKNYPLFLKTEKQDITSLTYSNDTFDIIICSHVLEHVVEDAVAIQEISRVLKENGIAYIMVPIDYSKINTYEDNSITSPYERKIAFGQEDHVRWYGLDFKSKLTKEGFNVEIIETRSIPVEKRKLFSLALRDEIFICSKNPVL